MKTKRKAQPGLFDEEIRLHKLSTKGDPLEKLNKKIRSGHLGNSSKKTELWKSFLKSFLQCVKMKGLSPMKDQ